MAFVHKEEYALKSEAMVREKQIKQQKSGNISCQSSVAKLAGHSVSRKGPGSVPFHGRSPKNEERSLWLLLFWLI